MYPPESLFHDPSSETPPTSPLHSQKSSPILPKVDYAEAFTRVYRDSPQSSSPPSSLCPSSPPGIHHIYQIPEILNLIFVASVTSLGHADVGPPIMKRRGGKRHSKHISQSSYHPYLRKTPPTPQAERNMAKAMGRLTSNRDSDLDDDTVSRYDDLCLTLIDVSCL